MMQIRAYARTQAATRLDRLAYDLNRAAKQGDATSIHHLRVAIRRFTQCLKVFRPFFPKAKARRIRKQVRSLMELAAAVRERDIALELLAEAGIGERSKLAAGLRREREEAENALLGALRTWRHRGFSRKWRDALEL